MRVPALAAAAALLAAAFVSALAAQEAHAPPRVPRPPMSAGRSREARSPAGQPADTTPAGVVRALYAFHFAHDMAFTRAAVRARNRWLASDLLALCRTYFAAPDTPDEVPAIDGDAFTDSQEYPRSFQVGRARVAGDTATVPVALLWPAGDRRVVRVVLVPERAAWRVVDVRYPDGPSLRELLSPRR